LSDLERAAKRLADGDDSAFAEIVDATSTKLVRMAARMVGSVADAEDVVQDAYIKAHAAITSGSFDGRSRLETWLYRIVINGAIDARRKRKRRPTDELVEETGTGASWAGAATAESTVALRELASWLGELPEEQQTALVLKAVEGMSSAEIAEVMECSEGAVEQRLVRARATLREKKQ
jgi:RNA polymerase sigma-70 factor (ECF subfamily)